MRLSHLFGAAIASAYGWLLWWLYTPLPPWRSVWYDPLYPTNLIIHEAGHWIFLPFGEFMGILGGSLLQWIMPLLFVVYFLFKKQWYSASIVGVWLAAAILNSVPYIADGRFTALPLLADGAIHDWNYILRELSLLDQSIEVATYCRWIGLSVLSVSVVTAWITAWTQKDARTSHQL